MKVRFIFSMSDLVVNGVLCDSVVFVWTEEVSEDYLRWISQVWVGSEYNITRKMNGLTAYKEASLDIEPLDDVPDLRVL